MIVQPDFLDHWKTQLLIDILQDETAPLYVIRLWAHCQNRKTHAIPNDNPNVTKAICRALKHDAKVFHDAMVEAGFIEEIDGELVAHGWDDVNSTLLRNWSNGKKGGRPKKKTQPKPKHNPTVTPAEPIRVDKMRLDEIREDEIGAGDSFPHLLSLLREKQTMKNAVAAVYASNDSFTAVPKFAVENSLKAQADKLAWADAIEGMASKFAGVKMEFPNRALQNWLAGKPTDTGSFATI